MAVGPNGELSLYPYLEAVRQCELVPIFHGKMSAGLKGELNGYLPSAVRHFESVLHFCWADSNRALPEAEHAHLALV